MTLETSSGSERIANRAERLPATILAAYGDDRASGIGRIWDLSASGARIEEVSYLPHVGIQLTLIFAPQTFGAAIEIRAEVVRWTATGGFSVRFRAMDEAAEALLLSTLNEAAWFLGKSEPEAPGVGPD